MKNKKGLFNNLSRMILYELTKDTLIGPKESFNKDKISHKKEFINKNNIKLETDEIILHNVRKKIIKGRSYFICPFINYYDIYTLNSNSLIAYSPQIQKNSKLTENKFEIEKEENIDLKTIDGIAILVEIDELPEIMLNLNVIETNSDTNSILYKEKSGDLIIKYSLIKGIFADDIDGYRLTFGILEGVNRANVNDKHLIGGVRLLITKYRLEEAQIYINKQDKLNKENNKEDSINILYDGF